MKKRPSQSSDLLFEDLSVQQVNETIKAPVDDSLDGILEELQKDHACGGCKPGYPIVFGEGRSPADLMLIGEGPGIEDIPSGLPFQGPAGLLLTKMLAAIHVARQECYICNVIKCVPPGERKFSLEEIEGCRPFLLRQILAVKPRVILAFGALAAQTLLRSKKTITDLRGEVFTYRLNDREINLLPSFNPAYLLRVPEKKREAWEDLKRVRSLLNGEEAG